MTPYLSIVCGIGGVVTDDLLDRLNASTNRTAELAAEFHLAAELIIVEWNMEPMEIDDVIPVVQLPIRIIHAGEAHNNYPNPHGFAYFEMPSKNVGIRRAHGEFILSSNPDDLYSRDLFEFFSRRLLEHGCFYRANRHDTRDGRVYRVCRATGCYAPEATEEQTRVSQPGAAPWSENMLHFNAAGDMVLMAKSDWELIHGNPEHVWNHSVDGETVWLAHTHGLKQIVLPYAVYHPDHPRSLNIAGNGQPFYGPPWEDSNPHATKNDESWGHAGTEFEETIL